MTHEEVMNLEGRRLDAAVAEKVMGFRVNHSNGSFAVVRDNERSGMRPYSTSIEAAWEVVEKIKAEMQDVIIRDDPYQGCTCQISLISVAKAKTAPEAICKAALLATLED